MVGFILRVEREHTDCLALRSKIGKSEVADQKAEAGNNHPLKSFTLQVTFWRSYSPSFHLECDVLELSLTLDSQHRRVARFQLGHDRFQLLD